MAEALIPEIVPGLVAVRFTGKDNEKTGEKKGAVKNVFPIDAKELVAGGDYELVDNGAVEAARLNANPLRSASPDTKLVVTEVTGIAGQVHVAPDEKQAEDLRQASDGGGDPIPADEKLVSGKAVPQDGKAPGTPTGAKAPDDKK